MQFFSKAVLIILSRGDDGWDEMESYVLSSVKYISKYDPEVNHFRQFFKAKVPEAVREAICPRVDHEHEPLNKKVLLMHRMYSKILSGFKGYEGTAKQLDHFARSGLAL